MLVLICGKSGTGKTAVSKLLQDKYHWRRITTCTTRPKRQNETNEYIFMDNDVFDVFVKKNQFVEVAEYNATHPIQINITTQIKIDHSIFFKNFLFKLFLLLLQLFPSIIPQYS